MVIATGIRHGIARFGKLVIIRSRASGTEIRGKAVFFEAVVAAARIQEKPVSHNGLLVFGVHIAVSLGAFEPVFVVLDVDVVVVIAQHGRVFRDVLAAKEVVIYSKILILLGEG